MIKNTILFAISGALFSGSNLVLLPALSEIFTVNDWAYVSIYLSTISISSQIISCGLNNYIYVIGQKTSATESFVLENFYGCVMFISIFFIFILLIIGGILLFVNIGSIIGLQNFSVGIFCICVITGYFLAVFQLYSGYLIAYRKSNQYLKVSACFFIVCCLVTIAFANGLVDDIYRARIYGQFLAALILLVIIAASNKIIFINMNFLKQLKVYSSNYTKHATKLMPHIIGGLLYNQFDKYIISAAAGTEVLGAFFLSSTLIQPITLLIDSMAKSMMPDIIVSTTFSSFIRNKIFKKYMVFIFVLIFLSIILNFIFSEINIFSDKYSHVFKIMPFLLFAQLFYAAYLILFNINVMHGKQSKISIVTILTGSLYLAILSIFVPYFGLIGLGVSFIIAHVLMAIGLSFVLVKS